MDFKSLSLLIMRVGFGGVIMLKHGLPKLLNFTKKMHAFPDPLGIGSTMSLSLLVTAEFFCAIAIIIGLFTRVAAVPLVIAMGVAFFVFHAQDPFAKKEMALLFFLAFSAILAGGSGRYSADNIFRRVR